MPKVVETTVTLIGLEMRVGSGSMQAQGEDGQPVEIPVTVIELLDNDGTTYRVPLTEDSRAGLIRKLTGGVVVPAGAQRPPTGLPRKGKGTR